MDLENTKKKYRVIKMLRAYKVEIKPTEEQKLRINQTIGICRFVYNLYISEEIKRYEEDGQFLTGFDFSKCLNNTLQ